jgi:hypothetical protein
MEMQSQRGAPQVSILKYDELETMGKELVRLCDIMEKHGLVDYQMGVWEEEIITRESKLDSMSTILIIFSSHPMPRPPRRRNHRPHASTEYLTP